MILERPVNIAENKKRFFLWRDRHIFSEYNDDNNFPVTSLKKENAMMKVNYQLFCYSKWTSFLALKWIRISK